MISIGRTLWFLIWVAVVWSGLTMYQVLHYTTASPVPDTCRTAIECKLTSPIAALELAGSEAVFKERIDETDGNKNRTHNIEVAADNTWMDFLYIPMYWSVFVLFGRRFPGRLTVWVIVAISGAAIFDLGENFLLLHSLYGTAHGAAFTAPGLISHIKWNFFAVASALLGLNLVTQKPRTTRWVAVPMLFSSIFTFTGQFWIPLLLVSVTLLLVAMLAAIVIGFPFLGALRSSGPGAGLRWLNYLYFVRFSLLLWFMILALTALDTLGITSSVTLGIFTPETCPQLIYSSFFIVVSGWMALTLARIICAYGQERFGTPPPDALVIGTSMNWAVFLFVQLPGLVLLDRIARNANREGLVRAPIVILCLLVGALLASLFWITIAILYYWTYQPTPLPPQAASGALGPNPPHDDPPNPLTAPAFLIPNSPWLRLEKLEELPNPPLATFVRWLQGLVASLGAGYQRVESESLDLYSGHAVGLFLFFGFFALYIGLMSITAPIGLGAVPTIIRVLVAAVFLAAIVNFVVGSRQQSSSGNGGGSSKTPGGNNSDPHRGSTWYLFLAFLATAVLIAFGAVIFWQPSLQKTFPVVASVFVLIIFMTSTLSGLAFWADRFRIPVLTLALLLITLMNLRPLRVDHVFDSVPREPLVGPNAPKTPGKVFHAFEPEGTVRPLIVVTSTGGGIQAAMWTAEVLKSLEELLPPTSSDKTKYGFHDSLLLLSTVSGGSVGTMPFLREYTTSPRFQPGTLDNRLVKTSSCSSLEAAAWGLVYPDLARLLLPGLFRVNLLHVRIDRGMTLEQALAFSLKDPICHANETTTNTDSNDPLLSSLIPGAWPDGVFFPAFTFNTTATETGDRFLLANYQIEAQDPKNCLSSTDESVYHSDTLPAESFLEAYAEPCARSVSHTFADLRLTTAARLSASFTYVSPAARIDSHETAQFAYHFVDGGYFDNDGTGSVIEFLRAIEKDSAFGLLAGKTQPILLIEIRDGSDVLSDRSPDSYSCQVGHCTTPTTPSPWGPWRQLAAPPQAMFLAGHEGITRRNRRELCLLEDELNPANRPNGTGGVVIHHVVFPISVPNAALSWHLTHAQITAIRSNAPDMSGSQGSDRNNATDEPMRKGLADAENWFLRAQSNPNAVSEQYKTCEVYPQ